MKTKATLLFLMSLAFIVNYSCKKEKTKVSSSELVLPSTPYSYGLMNSNTATLGRVLFYDTHLSVNNSISCGTCHKQSLAFSDNVALSSGFENRFTIRNTPPIQNLLGNLSPNDSTLFSTVELFWDGREKLLPSMVMKPVLNHVEMGMMDEDAVTSKVNSQPYYAALFYKAYGNSTATKETIAKALGAFTASIVSNHSTFDKVLNGSQNSGSLTLLEQDGMNLFNDKYNCNTCHNTEEPRGYNGGGSGSSDAFVNIGLDAVYKDNGFGNISKNSNDNGKFKIPNLKNVALTAPYMHDGRFKTLDEVLDHYSNNIAPNPNLDFRLKNFSTGLPIKFNITEHDRIALKAFLNSMTDYDLITDPKFSNPFKSN